MLEIYDLLSKGNKCGELYHDTKNKTFKARLIRKIRGEFPIALFTIDALKEVGDKTVKEWIKNKVAPPTRQNITEMLYDKGLDRYDPWEIYKSRDGFNANDYTTIKLNRTEDAEL